jgi:hypothetical protein
VAENVLHTKVPLAPAGFVAALPQRLMAHPKGGALAVIGHVERAWGYSFAWSRAGEQLETFRSSLNRLLLGDPVGWATEHLGWHYTALAADLSEELENIKFGKIPDNHGLSRMWTTSRDVRNLMILGDPAVRLPVSIQPDITRKRSTS